MQIRGAARDLPASIDLAAFRIVQEALTNTRRHAGSARALVLPHYEALDGIATTGSRADGGFRVCVHLPQSPQSQLDLTEPVSQ